jgi:DNA-binding NtrC family response regulator
VPAIAEFAVDSPLFSRALSEDAEGVPFRCPSTPHENGGDNAFRVLLVGCDAELQSHLRQRLFLPQWQLSEASSGAAALHRFERERSDLVLVAASLPDLDVAEFQQLLSTRHPGVQVLRLRDLVASARTDGPPSGVLPVKNPDPNDSNRTVSNVQGSALTEGGLSTDWQGMVGASSAMQSVFRKAALVARRDTTVLILGKSGTGKDLLARGIHNASARARHPFVVINCAAIPETLLEAELFGYAKGAFTGASQSRAGRVHAAQGGTLFLDEIGDMPLPLQSKILRFLEQGEIQRIGGTETVKVDCRIVAATNADLQEQVKARQFREDLYYRLAVMPIAMPALLDRMSDLPALAERFLNRFCPGAELDPGALEILMRHRWPGNIRELRNVMERATLFAEDRRVILAEDVVL